MSKVIFTVFIFLAEIVWAEKYALLVGGGGEVTSTGYTYQQGVTKAFKALSEGGYQIQTIYNGKDSGNTSDLTKLGAKKITAFKASNVQSAIDNYVSLIKSGKIHSGDQLFISIMSHGSPQDEGQMTHNLATNKIEDEAFENFSVDKFKALTDLAAQKGIKIAIADGSCYSGSTLALANANTCVMAAAGSDGPAVWSMNTQVPFLGILSDQLKPGKNLLDSFLDARKKHVMGDYPSISSLQASSKEYFDAISLVTQTEGKVTIESLNGLPKRPQLCLIDDSGMQKIKTSLSQLSAQVQNIATQQEVEKLQSMLEAFHQKKKIIMDENERQIAEMKQKTHKIGEQAYSEYELAISVQSMLIMDMQCHSLKEKPAFLRLFTPSNAKKACVQAQAIHDFFKQTKEGKEMEEKYSIFLDYKQKLSQLKEEVEPIVQQERVVYDLLARQKADEADACQSFKF